MSMNRDRAIEYLEDKGVIEGKKSFSKKEEDKIEDVMKHGKIYGDPVANVY